jgi:hypothetical protein
MDMLENNEVLQYRKTSGKAIPHFIEEICYQTISIHFCLANFRAWFAHLSLLILPGKNSIAIFTCSSISAVMLPTCSNV